MGAGSSEPAAEDNIQIASGENNHVNLFQMWLMPCQ